MHFLDSRGPGQVREAWFHSLLSLWGTYGWQELLPSLAGIGLLCFQPEVAKASSTTDHRSFTKAVALASGSTRTQAAKARHGAQ